MSPHRRPGAAQVLVVALGIALAVVLAACAEAPAASFAAEGPCAGDGRAPGTYPRLEALLPGSYEGEAPDTVDSGRTCTTSGLATLADAGATDVRFAGSTWDLGSGRGLTVAVFEGAGVTPTTLMDFYATGAQEARRTEKAVRFATTVAGRPAERLDVLWASSGQTVVTWPSADGERTWVLLAADLGDTKVAEALDALGDR